MLKHGNKTWKCLYCDTTYFGWNATKALAHIAKIEGKDVAACRSIKISREKLKTYAELWGANQAGNASRKRAKENHVAAVEESQQSIAVAFQNQNKRRKSVAIGEGADARGTGAGGASEPVIVRSDTSQTTVDVSNNTRLTMAIADFIHGKGLPFNVAEDPRFLLILKLAKTVPGTYKPPGRKAMGGNLLDLNYATKMKEYEERLMTDVDVYGLRLYGDGATVRRMPLINVMASGVQERSAVLEIVDCSKHLSNGGKKDAEYIAELFKPHMEQLDSKKTLIRRRVKRSESRRVAGSRLPNGHRFAWGGTCSVFVFCRHCKKDPCSVDTHSTLQTVVWCFWLRCNASTLCNLLQVFQNV